MATFPLSSPPSSSLNTADMPFDGSPSITPIPPSLVPICCYPPPISNAPISLPDAVLCPNRSTMSNTDTTTPARRRVEVISSTSGNISYTPRDPFDWKRRDAEPPSFPSPRIQPRQRRPHSIHTLSYPPGFIPSDLRREHELELATRLQDEARQAKRRKDEEKEQKARQKRAAEAQQWRKSLSLERSSFAIKALDSLLATLSPSPIGSVFRFGSGSNSSAQRPRPPQPPQPSCDSPPTPSHIQRPPSLASIARRFSRSEPEPDPEPTVDDEPIMRAPVMVDAIRPPLAGPHANSHHRNSIMSVRSAKSVATSSVAEIQKPVASGSGVACSIRLAEPNVFLTGFDHDGQNRPEDRNATALLRGTLQLSVSKNIKIKAITLKLVGKARTEWPEGIPPLKVDQFEEETLRAQSLVFFHAMHLGIWETEFGNQCTYNLKGSSGPMTNLRPPLSADSSVTSLSSIARSRQSISLSPKELKRLSLRSANSRSFGKDDNPAANPVQAKGYKVFYPGTYEYSFELPIDHHQLETTKLQYGSVKWELEAIVERAGAFRPNLRGAKEVSVVRVPDQLSLEMTEPISISRQWEDQMHYDIVISGKSFPIGGKIPIAFKLTPLAKVQIHKLKVFLTESVEYRTNNRRVTRKDPGRKMLLLEKAAGKPLDKQYSQSEFHILGGGELSPGERVEARAAAARRRTLEAARTNRAPEPLPEPADNLLGDLDLGLETYWCSTEIEMNVQIPTCEMMAKDKGLRLNPDCSWKNANVFHWIKVVLRISRVDPEDPTGRRRRHFEISIDSPITVLNCRATQANTSLPRYSGLDRLPASQQQQPQTTCGCPDALATLTPPTSTDSPSSSTASLESRDSPANSIAPSALPAPPQAAHFQSPAAQSRANMAAGVSPRNTWPLAQSAAAAGSSPYGGGPAVGYRPMELLRYPSYNPPAFDADEPPPPLPIDPAATPPPNYDAIVGTPSVDGLADYFARLADYNHDGGRMAGQEEEVVVEGADYLSAAATVSRAEEEEADEEDDSDSGDEHHPARIHRGGRVNVANPRTPGGRMVPSRSLELERPAMVLSMAGVVRNGE